MVDQTRKAEKALHKGEAPRPSLHHKCRPMKSFKRSFSTLGEADSGSIEILTVLKRRSLVGMQSTFQWLQCGSCVLCWRDETGEGQ